MATLRQKTARRWTRGSLFISTDHSLIPIPQLIDVFASDSFYWADPLSEGAMQEMLENSLSFGVFDTDLKKGGDENKGAENEVTTTMAPATEEGRDGNPPRSAQAETERGAFVGFARCVTDFVTFAYLTDVWVDPAYRGGGLGTWLVRCVDELAADMPHLRRILLFTSNWDRSVPFYEKHLGMRVLECRRGQGPAVMDRKGPGFPSGLDSHT